MMTAQCLLHLRMRIANTNHVHNTLTTCWRLSSRKSPRIAPTGGMRRLQCDFSTSSRGASWNSPPSQVNTNRYGNNSYTQFGPMIALLGSVVIVIGMTAYRSHQDSIRTDTKELTGGADHDAKGVITADRRRGRASMAPLAVKSGRGPHSSLDMYEVLEEELPDIADLPKEEAILTAAPYVPPPITRDYPVLLQVPLTTTTKTMQITSAYKYERWTFNDTVPGPFIRARAGDVVELTLTNRDESGNPHNIDCHAFTGPGGGAPVTTAEENETKVARFRLLYPGLYLYHCAAAPVPVHIANGMYGLMYVQPADEDLPPVDREYYVMQSEVYHEPPEILEDGRPSSIVEFSYPNALREDPSAVVFNGRESALTLDQPLKARTGESIRIYFGNAGPNLTSSFHVIGSNFRKVYRDGDIVGPPGENVQTISVPAGSASIVDMKMVVPGTYTLLDHAIFRLDKGAVGYLNVSGKPRPDIFQSTEPPAPCVGCKLHP